MGQLLKIQEMSLDGLPLTCPECGSGAFTLEGRGAIAALASVWANCSNYHSWEHQLITTSDLAAIQAARTGREKATDVDTFEIEIGGAVLAGILVPELTVDDVKTASRIYWQKLIKPRIRRQKRAAIRAVKRPLQRAGRAVTQPIADGAAAVKAQALEAAWTAQAGGYQPDPDHQPEPVNPCPACNGKGAHRIDTRLHDTTTVRCSVCHGTGEID
ncbi:hypothetical protein ACF1AL_14810 [Streptomyces sp. NPDC014801]|uniref:hypothetical protein n=1 Tax=Streptomyces sp. NPDC014801 TaxID=3364916 RepID=UPI0036FAE16D